MSASHAELLTLAREARGLTQGALAEASGLSQATISRMESGLLEIEGDPLTKVSAALDVPEEFFSALSRIRVGGMCLRYRRRKTMPVRLLKKVEARTAILAARIWRLCRGLELEAENQFLRFDLADGGDVASPEEAAGRLRAAWGMPLGHVHNVTQAIEDAGGIVVLCDFESPKVDAISQWLPPEPPLIFANVNAPGDRLRWNLAHEIGHLVLHHAPGTDEEQEANRFASEFLMPERDIRPELQGLTLARLGALKQAWAVSMQALAYRARDLGCITGRYYEYLNVEFSRRGWRRTEPIEVPQERPKLLADILNHYVKEMNYSHDDLRGLLAISSSDFDHDFGGGGSGRPRLRLA